MSEHTYCNNCGQLACWDDVSSVTVDGKQRNFCYYCYELYAIGASVGQDAEPIAVLRGDVCTACHDSGAWQAAVSGYMWDACVVAYCAPCLAAFSAGLAS